MNNQSRSSIKAPIEVNAVLVMLKGLLELTAGPSIRIDLQLSDGAPMVDCDLDQLEAALLSLAVISRDGTPTGGRLRIETCEAELLASRPRLRAGRYVVISSTEVGMPSAATRSFADIVLAWKTIRGFVKRSAGHMEIHAGVGKGASITLYLPRADERYVPAHHWQPAFAAR